MKLRSVQVWLQLSALLLFAAGSGLGASGVMAQTNSSQSSKKDEAFVYVPPTPPADQGAPLGRQQGGASRGSCNDYAGLTALVPEEPDGMIKGLTTVDEPTLMFYVPVALSPETKVELVVQDQDDEYVTRRRLDLQTDSAGIVPVKLKRLRKELEVGQDYQWTLSIYCDPSRKSASVYVQGLLGRASDDAFRMEQMPSFERAAQYARQGIWFESLTLLAQLRQSEPNNLTVAQAWYDLLQQVELGSVAPAKLLVPEELGQVSELR